MRTDVWIFIYLLCNNIQGNVEILLGETKYMRFISLLINKLTSY